MNPYLRKPKPKENIDDLIPDTEVMSNYQTMCEVRNLGYLCDEQNQELTQARKILGELQGLYALIGLRC